MNKNARLLLAVIAVGLGGYGVARLAARSPGLPAWGGALLGASVSGCLWFAEVWLERQEPHSLTYLALPAAGLVGLGSAAFTTTLGRRLWQRWLRSQRVLEDL